MQRRVFLKSGALALVTIGLAVVMIMATRRLHGRGLLRDFLAQRGQPGVLLGGRPGLDLLRLVHQRAHHVGLTTGGHLLQACFSTGAAAGRGVADWLRETAPGGAERPPTGALFG